jgi:hypothetical protein
LVDKTEAPTGRRLRELDELGRQELIASAELCRRVADGREMARPEFREALRRLDDQIDGLRTLSTRFGRTDQRERPDDYFARYVDMEPRLRATISGLTASRDATRRQRLLLDRDVMALLTGRGEIEDVDRQIAAVEEHLAAEPGDQSERLKAIRTRRGDLAVQIAVIDQAVAGLRLAAATTQTLDEAVNAALLETVLALRTVALTARTLVRRRVILERIRAEADAIGLLAGAQTAGSGSVAETLAKPGSWETLAIAWHRVERAAKTLEGLRDRG